MDVDIIHPEGKQEFWLTIKLPNDSLLNARVSGADILAIVGSEDE